MIQTDLAPDLITGRFCLPASGAIDAEGACSIEDVAKSVVLRKPQWEQIA